jgi:hypothetical protein
MFAFSVGGGLTHCHPNPALPIVASIPFWEWQAFMLALVLEYSPLFVIPVEMPARP